MKFPFVKKEWGRTKSESERERERDRKKEGCKMWQIILIEIFHKETIINCFKN